MKVPIYYNQKKILFEMSHVLEPDATKHFLASAIAGYPAVKKNAARFTDQLSTLFIMHLDQAIAEISKGKSFTQEDVIKALKENGLEDYVSAFKEGMKEEPKEAEEAPKKKREKDEDKDKKSKKK